MKAVSWMLKTLYPIDLFRSWHNVLFLEKIEQTVEIFKLSFNYYWKYYGKWSICFFLTLKWIILGGAAFWILFIHYVSCLSVTLSCLFLVALWSPGGKGLASWLSGIWCFLVLLSLYDLVSLVRCGTWLYRFLVLAFFFTFKMDNPRRWFFWIPFLLIVFRVSLCHTVLSVPCSLLAVSCLSVILSCLFLVALCH